MNAHRGFQRRIEIVNEDRQTGDVVHVRMRDDYVTYCVPLIRGESDGQATGVNCHAVVDKVTGQTLFKGRLAVTIEGAG
jgi:hypothetical protein